MATTTPDPDNHDDRDEDEVLPAPDDDDALGSDVALGHPVGSEELDLWLITARDVTIPATDFDIDEDDYPPAAQRIEDATQRLYTALADVIDAIRSHPDYSYEDAVDTITDITATLPEPPAEMPIPAATTLTRAEERALLEGRGDTPIGA